MSRAIDMSGRRFGRLTVLRRAGSDRKGQAMWACECDCGARKVLRGAGLRKGSTQSCGCLFRELARERGLRGTAPSFTQTTHGRHGTREYESWRAMVYRCTNPNGRQWDHYGGRGIQVCAEWRQSFGAFYADMGPRPKGTSLDRIDNDGNYEPGNCRWATRRQQQRNKRVNRTIAHAGEALTLVEWAERTALCSETIAWRIDAGWSTESALTTPVRGGEQP